MFYKIKVIKVNILFITGVRANVKPIGTLEDCNGYPAASIRINFSTSFVIDAWTETITKNNSEYRIDYIKLNNGVLITIDVSSISVFDSDDIAVEDGVIAFKNIATRGTPDGKAIT